MLVAVAVFLLGLCVGSFTNVLIFRLPESESVVHPGSHCRRCGKPLAWYENIPLLSYLALGGRCRGCRTRISVQYPLVELAVGLVFVGNYLWLGRASGSAPEGALAILAEPRWIVGAVFATLLLAIAVTDLRTYLIPDELSLGGLGLGLTLSLLPGDPRPLDSLIGAVVGGGLLFGVAWLGGIVFKKEAMGGGDIKMLAMIGAFVGWPGVFLTLFLGAVLGSVVYGPVVLILRLRRRAPEPVALAAAESPLSVGEAVTDESSGPPEALDRGLVPFGFFLAPAAALTFYFGEGLVDGYLRLVGLSA